MKGPNYYYYYSHFVKHCKRIVMYILLLKMEKSLVIDVAADDDVYKMDLQWHVCLRSYSV